MSEKKKKKKLLLETGEPHQIQSHVSESITCKYCSKAMANSVFLFWKQIFSDSWCFLIVRVITFPLPAVVTTEKNGPSNPSQSIRTYHAFIYSLSNLLKCVIINYIYLCRNMKTRKKKQFKGDASLFILIVLQYQENISGSAGRPYCSGEDGKISE